MAQHSSAGDGFPYTNNDYSDKDTTTTKVMTNPSEIERTLAAVFANIQYNYDIINDAYGVTVATSVESITKLLREAHRRGVRIRFITEITKDNLSYCKQLMDIVTELRHLDGVYGNFCVSDYEYIAISTVQKKKPISMLTYSNVKEIVKQEQFMFDTLWNQAFPAKEIIEEIEKKKEEYEFLQVCSDRNKAADVYREFAGLVQKEALLILPDSKALQREYDLGILHKLVDAAVKRKAKIKIICPLDEQNAKIAKWLSDSGSPTIQLLNGDKSKSTIFVVDDKLLFRAELRDDATTDFYDAIGYALYSNSKPSVSSFKSFFEMLWNSRLLAEKLRETDRIQREFINVAAHELRSPIQPILGMAELIESALLQERKAVDDDVSNYHSPLITPEKVEIIVRNARRLQRLSEEILDIARIENNSLILHKTLFNLKQDVIIPLIRDCRKQIEMDGRDIEIVYIQQRQEEDSNNNSSSTDDAIQLYADKERIMQVLGNLLSNALKFTEQGSITIYIHYDKECSQLTIKVSDTGSGIDPTILSRLFTKFATKSSYKGTGLGLYISKSITQAHGGKIWAENNDENRKGATIAFTLPIK